MSVLLNPNPTIKPPIGSRLNPYHPLTPHLKAAYVFNEWGSTNINDLTCYQKDSFERGNNIGLGTSRWVGRQTDFGVYFDNTQAAVGYTVPTPLDINTVANGLWFEAIEEFTLFFKFTLEPPALGGPLILLEVGGDYHGFSVEYRTTPQQITFALTDSGTAGTFSELYATDVIAPSYDSHTVMAVYDHGEMILYQDGVLQGKLASGYAQVSYHASLPGLGGTGAGETTGSYWTLYSSADEWSGILSAFYFADKAFYDAELLHREPYGITEWPSQRTIIDFGAPLGRISRYHSLNGIGAQGQQTWNPLG